MTKKPQLLAPAGGREQLIAAVRSGADAVYLGAGGFNARAGAENFGDGALRDAVAYCHGRGVRVHVTLNTLVTDRETSALLDQLEEIANSVPLTGGGYGNLTHEDVLEIFRACY